MPLNNAHFGGFLHFPQIFFLIFAHFANYFLKKVLVVSYIVLYLL